MTPVYKLMPVFITLCGVYGLIQDGTPSNIGGYLLFILLLSFWCLATYKWKSVYLNNGSLSVSNYVRRIVVPVSNIKRIEVRTWWRPQTIKLTLKSPSAFGQEIVFVPRPGGLDAGRIAAELRALTAARRSGSIE
jgi:hypothetical protein